MASRLGVDVGGTKIEVVVLDATGAERMRRRTHYPNRDYQAALDCLVDSIRVAEDECEQCSIGVGLPGFIDRESGLLENAFNTPYNKRPLKADLENRLSKEVHFANDANCFALSEAADGAARGARVVFGAILGTGAGGGIVVGGRVLNGRHGIAGEWGHTPLPWIRREEHPGPMCNCGRNGCIEQFVSGPALAREKSAHGDENGWAIYADRLARAFSVIVNFLDPDIIVVGGGVSKESRIYASVPALLKNYAYTSDLTTPIVAAKHGDASGVRGAAMLWPA